MVESCTTNDSCTANESCTTNYAPIADAVALCAQKCGRQACDVSLIAVSKTVDIDAVLAAIAAGAHNFGENRPDELARKATALPDETWHFIGNIQSRKIPEIVQYASLIHSLFDAGHAAKISAEAQRIGKIQDVLVEVNVSGELSKSGLAPNEAAAFVCEIANLPSIRVRGLMTMAPQGDLACAQESFKRLTELRAAIAMKLPSDKAEWFTELSMGMSEDWPQAIAAGATFVRIGRAIFENGFVDPNKE